MKKTRTYILIFILFTGNLAYTQEIQKSVNKTFIKEKDSVPLKPLFEMFTSSTCGPCVEASEVLEELFENNSNEYASIKYQMDWPGSGDPYYTEEGGVRRAYYGVYSVPDLFINAEKLDPATSITQEIFDDYAAQMTNMEIEITEAFINEDNLISVEAEITALSNYDEGLTAHLVVVEKKTYNNVGTNGETEFHNVMMKMLPDAGGTELDALSTGEIVTLSDSYNMNETFMETPNDLAIIVFVQDNTDKSVIQSEMINVEGDFEAYNITYIVENVFGNPIENAEVLLENYGSLYTIGNGQVLFEEVLNGTYEYSVNYAGLVPYSNTISVMDTNITHGVVMDHYSSLLESFNSGLPASWTKHVSSSNFLNYNQSAMKFSRFSGMDDNLMLISPAVEVNPDDTMSFQFGETWNNSALSYGIISNPYDPESFIELGFVYPSEEWETLKYAMNNWVTSDTVMYFAWKHASINESSFFLDNVFLLKEGEVCIPLYSIGCSNLETGFTDFMLEQITNSNSGCAELKGKGWSQYFNLGPAELLAGEDYTISMATGYDNVHASVWIDFNDDFIFTTEEMVIDNFLMEQPGILYDVELTIPTEAADGLHLMRARTNGYDLCNDPCEEYYYGEAEDYLVLVGEELILPPTNLVFELAEEDIILDWDAPVLEQLIGYNVYYAHESGTFEVLTDVTETSFTHEAPGYGLHQYYVTADYYTGESDPTNTVEILITGVQRQLENSFQIYPNPASDVVNIKSGVDIASVKVYNHSGQIVHEKMLQNKIYQINVSKLIPGLYFFQIETTEGTFNQRIIIQ